MKLSNIRDDPPVPTLGDVADCESCHGNHQDVQLEADEQGYHGRCRRTGAPLQFPVIKEDPETW